jgi:Transmembrane domain of unknown function (DUF3566)
LDRRTNGPEGSGGASPTIVTSRTGDDVDDDEVTQATGIMAAPPRRTPRKPAAGTAPVTTAPANGDISDRKANGAVAASDAPASDAPASDAPASDAPASDQTTGTPSAVGPMAASGQDGARGAEADATLTDLPALPADLIGPVSSGSSPPVNETPTVSPAAFAWEMPDPPPSSPSSPARTFLRAGTNVKSAIKSRTPGTTTGPGAGKTAAGETAAPAGTGVGGTASAGTASAGAPPRSGPKKASAKRSARQAHLTVARVEPWSVMKFSFVVSLVAFVILFVAVSLLYGALDGLGVFESLQRLVSSLTSSQGSAGVNASKWFSASRVLGYTALLGSLNIVLITAMSTIGAVVYNLTSRLVGGVEVTLRETE